MNENNILDYLNERGVEYINKIIGSNNKTDYRKIKKLFLKGIVELNNFPDCEMVIGDFEWAGEDRDRNWWWQMQSLPFLAWYVNSYNLQTDLEKKSFFNLCWKSLENWKDKALKAESPLVWHDHASAFRVRNIVNWLVFCCIHASQLNGDIKNQVSILVKEHLCWLSQDKNFSRYTNHGFDQAMISLVISLMFGGGLFEKIKIINKERLLEELRHAFTDEGVHKENSPGYQKFMLERVRQLRIIKILGETDVSDLVDFYVDKAEVFLRALTLPNGYLPLIGDTKLEMGLMGSDIDCAKVHPYLDVYDYSKSGYLIAKGVDGLQKSFFLLLKNSHLSNYHRHDDDMMIYLFYDGEVVFGDGGLFNHQEKDGRRKNIRSYRSHCVPYIDSLAIRDRRNLSEDAVVETLSDREFYMESSMFGKRLCRRVCLEIESGLKLRINDRPKEKINEKVWSNFLIPHEKKFEIKNNAAVFRFQDFSCFIRYEAGTEFFSVLGWDDFDYCNGAYFSEKYGEIKSACRISFSCADLEIDFNSN